MEEDSKARGVSPFSGVFELIDAGNALAMQPARAIVIFATSVLGSWGGRLFRFGPGAEGAYMYYERYCTAVVH
jgi:hypothetical protein